MHTSLGVYYLLSSPITIITTQHNDIKKNQQTTYNNTQAVAITTSVVRS